MPKKDDIADHYFEKRLVALEKKQAAIDARLGDLEQSTLGSMAAAVNYFRAKGWTKKRIKKLLQL